MNGSEMIYNLSSGYTPVKDSVGQLFFTLTEDFQKNIHVSRCSVEYSNNEYLVNTDNRLPIATPEIRIHEEDNTLESNRAEIRIRRKWCLLYRFVYKDYYGESTKRGYNIHHKDFNRRNDSPDNLEMIPIRDHINIHITPEVRERSSETIRNSDRLRKIHSEIAKTTLHSPENEKKCREALMKSQKFWDHLYDIQHSQKRIDAVVNSPKNINCVRAMNSPESIRKRNESYKHSEKFKQNTYNLINDPENHRKKVEGILKSQAHKEAARKNIASANTPEAKRNAYITGGVKTVFSILEKELEITEENYNLLKKRPYKKFNEFLKLTGCKGIPELVEFCYNWRKKF